MARLKRLTVRGYKSIAALEDFELRGLNVLIGANGAGKSNFISLFRMMEALAEGRLQHFVQEQDGPDALLFRTRKRTPRLEVRLDFGGNGYLVSLEPVGERLIFHREELLTEGFLTGEALGLGHGQEEARLPEAKQRAFDRFVLPAISSWRVYHFHDTSEAAPIRHAQPVRDNLRLKPDGANLAAVLRFLRERHEAQYQRILETIRLVAPFFGDFVYRKDPGRKVELEWTDAQDPDTPYGPRQLSDGTLRFIALATLLLQPRSLQPDTILIDEPELGLHPYAVTVLAGILRQVADDAQLILTTQSVDLVNQLSPEDVVVVDRRDGSSVFTRPEADALADWLQDYALGELWTMNVLGGRPSR